VTNSGDQCPDGSSLDRMTELDSPAPLEVPVVMFSFKRKSGAVAVMARVAEARPRRLYLISDGGRDPAEHALVESCREAVEHLIDWDCEVIRNYSSVNLGVHDRIGRGARWVFEREESAIFLEDDNLPEPSFFPYCEELLRRYRGDTRVLWICGTNYLGEYSPPGGASYSFTKHLLPCGWASWREKFNRFYDEDLQLFTPELADRVKGEYLDRRLYAQDIGHIMAEAQRRDSGQSYWSWDYHMAYSIRVHGLLGIAPARNQIRNIGVDEFSAHGGTSFADVMTRRLCGMDSFALDLPLIHPPVVLRDVRFDRLTNAIVLYPLARRLKSHLGTVLKRILRLPASFSFTKAKAQLLKKMRAR